MTTKTKKKGKVNIVEKEVRKVLGVAANIKNLLIAVAMIFAFSNSKAENFMESVFGGIFIQT